MSTVSSRVTFNGKEFKFYSWECTRPAYGSVGTFSIVTSLQYLRESQVDIYTPALETITPIPIQIFATDQYGNNDVLIFGGEFDKAEYNLLADEVTLTGRDWAGYLMDAKVTLVDQTAIPFSGGSAPVAATSGIGSFNITNQTTASFLKQLASAYGFKLQLDDTYLSTTPIGALAKGFNVLNTTPRPVWDILVFLARTASIPGTVPYEVMMLPSKTLYFGPVLSQPLITLSWNRSAAYYAKLKNIEYPLMSLEITHQPRRNSTFGIVVLSYNASVVERSYGNIIYNNTANWYANNTSWQAVGASSPGFTIGKNPYGASNLLGDLGRPIYVFRIKQGLNATQAVNAAWHEALDIAKKEIIVEGVIDGLATLLPLQGFQLDGTDSDLLKFNKSGGAPRTFYISHVAHQFTVPQDSTEAAEGVSSGFVTRFSGWTLPVNIGTQTSGTTPPPVG